MKHRNDKKMNRFGATSNDLGVTKSPINNDGTMGLIKIDYNNIQMSILDFGTEIDMNGGRRIVLLRWLKAHYDSVGNMIFLVPEIVKAEYGIKLETIRSVLRELEENDAIEILQIPNNSLTYSQRIRKDDEQNYYEITLLENFPAYYDLQEATSAYQSDDEPVNVNAHKITATLRIENISNPIITVDNHTYKLPGMRDGEPLKILSYLLNIRPNKALSLEELKEEMKAANTPLRGVDNINEAIRVSLLGKGMPLEPFVSSSPKNILIRTSVNLSKNEFEAIVNSASTRNKSE